MKSYIFSGLILLIGSLFLFGCSDDDNSNPIVNDDSTPPAEIIDLYTANPTGNSVTLYFTTPGDDGDLGRAAQYDIRYSQSMITESNFSLATQFDTTQIPNVGTNEDTILVTGLSPTTKYYFAVKVGDEIPNWSGISNIDSATTLSAGNWTIYTESNSDLPSNQVNDIAVNGNNRFFATDMGLAILNISGEMIIIDSTSSGVITTSLFNEVAVDPSDNIWLALQNDGLLQISDSVPTAYTSSSSDLLSNSISDLFTDTNDEIYIATLSSGINYYDMNSWDVINTDSGLAFNFVNTLTRDSLGNIWIAYNFGGVTKYDGAGFTHYNSSDGINSDVVWAIEPTGGAEVVFGTDDGLFVYDGSTFSTLSMSSSGLPDNIVTSMVSNGNTLWVGTRFGLGRYNGAEWTTYTTSNSLLPDNYIESLEKDNLGNILIGTRGGVAIFND